MSLVSLTETDIPSQVDVGYRMEPSIGTSHLMIKDHINEFGKKRRQQQAARSSAAHDQVRE